MSKDLIVFDPSKTRPVQTGDPWLGVIRDAVGEGEPQPQETATDALAEVIRWAGQTFGTDIGAESQWTLWPPVLLAGGRHCTFNLSLGADYMTFLMSLSDQCKRRGLVLIDPSGRNPFVTTPDGDGILD